MAALDFQASSGPALGNLEDADVVRVMRTGNLSALEILYQRYGDGVYRLAFRILGNRQDAEDLTQEIFLEFWRQQRYDPARGTVIVFLLTMTRSRAFNRIKKHQSGLHRLLHWQRDRSFPAKNIPFENATLEELSEQVKKALQTLPDKQRLVLEMAYYDGLSQSEIMQRLNLPLGTVKSQSRRALLKLRQQLEDWIE